MPTDAWRTVRLGEVADDVTVGHVGSMAAEYVESGIPFLRSLNIEPHRIDLAGVKFVSPEFHARLKKSALKPGDVVTVRTGKPGATAVVPDHLPEANCSDVVITRPGPELDPRWLSYYINGVATGYISSRLVGAVQQHFNVGSAKEMVLAMPPLAEQRGIAATLGALDDKIESNRRVIELSERLLDALAADATLGLPSATLGDLVVVAKNTVNPATLGTELVDHFSLPAFDEGGRPERMVAEAIMSNKLALPGRSVLLSRLNPRINRTWWATPAEGIPALSSTEFLCMRASSDIDLAAVWLALRCEEFLDQLPARVTGTSGSHQRVRPDDVLAIEVPDVSRLPQSAKLTALGLLEGAEQRAEERTRLAALRDAILPELLSGRIRMPEAQQAMAGVGA